MRSLSRRYLNSIALNVGKQTPEDDAMKG